GTTILRRQCRRLLQKEQGGLLSARPASLHPSSWDRLIACSLLVAFSPRDARGERCSRLRARERGECHSIVDGVEGVLGHLLGGLDLPVPGAAAYVRLAGRVCQHLRDRHAARPTKRAARGLIDAAAGRRAT